MSNVPDLMPVLSAGSHTSPAEGACVMELVSYLAGEEWSDSPACTHPVLATMAQRVNDLLPDSERHVLVPLIGRLFGTAEPADEHEAHVLSVRLAAWCAREVLDRVRPEDRAVAEASIAAAEGWCDGSVTATAARAAADATFAATYAVTYAATYAAAYAARAAAYAAAYAARAAADATYAVAFATNTVAHAADAAYAARAAADATYAAAFATNTVAHAADAAYDLVDLLTGLLDEYDRLTGRTQPREVTTTDLTRLAALTT